MEQSKSKGGRPPIRHRKPGERVPLGLRVTLGVKELLDQAARKSGRSQSQEAELRLEQSFAERAYPPEIGALAELLARTMAETGNFITGANRWSGHGVTYWPDDPYAYDQAVKAALQLLLWGRPE